MGRRLPVLAAAALLLFAACANNNGTGNDDDGTGNAGTPPPGMKYLAGGAFYMGSDDAGGNAAPRHVVSLSAFSMDTTEVTQKEYAELMAATYPTYTMPSWYAGQADTLPAYAVNWYDAVLFCNARSKRDGMDTVYYWSGLTGYAGDDCSLDSVRADFTRNGYRLPTEAEWEYAARGGVQTSYPWGDTYSDFSAGNLAWYSGNAGGTPRPVAQKQSNAFGLYDMLGNVHEWCHDRYNYSYYQTSPSYNPTGAVSGYYRIFRGGYYQSSGSNLALYYRSYDYPYDESYSYGFRCVQRGAFTDPPVISVTGDTVIAAGTSLTLTAAASSERAAIAWYFWAPDGATFTDSTASGTFTRTFSYTGNYQVRVKARDAAGYYTAVAVINVAVREAAPANVYPEDQEVIYTLQLRWSRGAYNDRFKVLLDTQDPPVTVLSSSVTDTFLTVTAHIDSARTYFWQVVGINAGGDTAAGPVWSFTTPASPPAVTYITGGTFAMGSTVTASEQPVRQVTVSSFYMDRYEVNQSQYATLMRVNPGFFSGTSLPVESITWYDAVLYCNARSAYEGLDTVYTFYRITGTAGNGCTDLAGLAADTGKNGYRLPTEAEWEYAARGGQATAYHFGDTDALLSTYAWYSGNAGNTTHTTGDKSPNQYGLYDMLGNVWEWCNDWYAPAYDTTVSTVNPTGPTSGVLKTARGGSYNYGSSLLRSAFRGSFNHEQPNPACGFRCVRR